MDVSKGGVGVQRLVEGGVLENTLQVPSSLQLGLLFQAVFYSRKPLETSFEVPSAVFGLHCRDLIVQSHILH